MQEEATWQEDADSGDWDPDNPSPEELSVKGMEMAGDSSGGPGADAGPPRADSGYIQVFLLKCGPHACAVRLVKIIRVQNLLLSRSSAFILGSFSRHYITRLFAGMRFTGV